MGMELSTPSLSFLIIWLISIDFYAFAQTSSKSSGKSSNFTIIPTKDMSIRQAVPIHLWCNISSKTAKRQKKLTVKWYKAGVLLDTDAQEHFVASPTVINGTVQQHHSLKLKSNDISMTGQYRCQMSGETGELGSVAINLYMPPAINTRSVSYSGTFNYLPSIDKIEGDNANLKCEVVGYPQLTYQWSNSRGILNSTTSNLELTNLQTDDRDEYKCFVANQHGNITLVQLVRVKSKLAPLWPAIGIVLIMVILVAIIAISEKRRKAQEADKDK